MAKDWVKNARSEAKAAFDARSEVVVKLGALKENQAKLAEQLKDAVRARDSSKSSLKNAEMQAEEQRKQLHYFQINLATEKQLVKSFRRPGKMPNWLKRQLRLRSKRLIHLEWRRLKSDLQRNFPQYAGNTAEYLGVKPLMLLGYLWILT